MSDPSLSRVRDGCSTISLTADDHAPTMRFDKWLSDRLPTYSRARLQALIRDGRVEVDERPLADPSARLKPGQTVRLMEPPPTDAEPQPQDIPLTVVYEDDDLIVIDKPAGLVVHPAAGNPDGTLVNALLAHCRGTLSGIGGVRRPGIVHRLDKDTSGVMVAAKTDLAHNGLAAQFASHSLKRAYHAVVWGVPAPLRGEIEGNIGRHPTQRLKMAVVAKGGKPALTRYRVLEPLSDGAAALVECRLATGRTHQVRVHMASQGHPLLGDPVYGRKKVPSRFGTALHGFERQALHAVEIGFTHPRTGNDLLFRTPPPADMARLLDALRNPAAGGEQHLPMA